MASKSVLTHAIPTRLSLTPTVQVATRYLGLFTAYFMALGGTVLAMKELKDPIQNVFGTESPYVFYGICFVPIAAVFLLHTLPSLAKSIRKRRLNAAIVRGQLKKGYCRLSPLGEDSQDTFDRPDGAHDKVFGWIRKTKEPILFLSGMSGCGKSSLLDASVLPRLRKHSPAYITLSVRSFEDPLQALREELTNQGLIKDDTSAEESDMKALLETACRDLQDRRLLVVFDQFEELLIIHGEQGRPTQRAIELLKQIKSRPIEHLTLLIVFRTEYQGLLIDAGLGPLNSERNWNVVDPFTTSGATSFLENSGLKLKNEQITAILTEASLYERTKGFVRPITLNMIGLALDRIAVPRQAVAIHGFDAGGILLNFTTESLERADPNGFAKTVMKFMLSADGTKIPQTIDQLHEKTRLRHGTIESLMLNCRTDGLVRILDEPRRLWEISHDFVANLIAKAVGRDDRTFFQKTRPWLMAFLLTGWVAFAAMLFWSPKLFQMSFKTILEYMDADYAEVYDPNNRQLDLRGLGVKDSDIALLAQTEEFKTLASLLMTGISISITDDGLEHLKGFKQLNTLGLSRCDQITDAGLEHLKDLNHLSILDLSDCKKITGAGLRHLKGLKILDLSDCEKITDKGLKHLKDLNHLSILDLSSCDKITDEGLEHLKDSNQLKALDLSDCEKITDEGLEHLKDSNQLKALDLSDCEKITDAGLEHLKDLNQLKALDLSSCDKITDEGLEHLKDLNQLNTLDLSDCEKITDAGLEHLKDLPLNALGLINCDNITGVGLECLEGLKILDLSWCDQFTDAGLEHLKGLNQLNYLDLSDCNKITDEGLEHLKGLNQLNYLDLSWCDKLTDVGLEHLKDLPLSTLHLSGCKQVTDEGLENLKGLPLDYLDLSDCNKITSEGLRSFKAQCSDVEVWDP
jgi:hypothetical protein